MKRLLFPKEYRELLGEKAHVEKELRWFLANQFWALGNLEVLKDVAELGIRGGAKDLSSKLDNYLYA